MEILRFSTLLLTLVLSGCSLISPVDFAKTLSDQGITSNLGATAQIGSSLNRDGASMVLAFVGSKDTLWIVTDGGVSGFRPSDLTPKSYHKFSAMLGSRSMSGTGNAQWNVVETSTGTVLWLLVYDNGYKVLEIADGVVSLVPADETFSVPIGWRDGADWTLSIDSTRQKVTFVGSQTGPPFSLDTFFSTSIQTSAESVFAVEATPAPTKLGTRKYQVGLTEWPIAQWGGSNAVRRTVSVTFPAEFGEGSIANGYSFRALQAGGRTFLIPKFGVAPGNNTSTSVAVIQNSSGKQLAAQVYPYSASVAVASGDAWYLLSQAGILKDAELRKYQW